MDTVATMPDRAMDVPWPDGKTFTMKMRVPAPWYSRGGQQMFVSEEDKGRWVPSRMEEVQVEASCRTFLRWQRGWMVFYHSEEFWPPKLFRLIRAIRKFRRFGITVEMERKP